MTEARRLEDSPQTKRESELRWAAHEHEHEKLRESLRIALEAVERERQLHTTAHDAAHAAHNREHTLDSKNAGQLLEAHAREHALEADALDKAAIAVDKRLEGMNEVRSQLKEQALTFARVDAVNSLTDRVIAIEKLDIKSEGRGLGQGAVLGAIVAAVGFAVTLITLVVIVANLLTGNPE